MGVSPAVRLERDRATFPAMNVDEILVWREWLRLHELVWDPLPQFWLALRAGQPGAQPQAGDKFDYNVRIGTGKDPGASFRANIRQMAIAVTQQRLDAVGFQGDQPTIFEVKRRVTAAQIGQVLAYLATWTTTKLTATPPVGRLVGADFDENALHLLQQTGLQLDIAPVNFSILSPYNTAPTNPNL